jgi:hypothetical protein
LPTVVGVTFFVSGVVVTGLEQKKWLLQL